MTTPKAKIKHTCVAIHLHPINLHGVGVNSEQNTSTFYLPSTVYYRRGAGVKTHSLTPTCKSYFHCPSHGRVGEDANHRMQAESKTPLLEI
jgi:hypothetical protein